MKSIYQIVSKKKVSLNPFKKNANKFNNLSEEILQKYNYLGQLLYKEIINKIQGNIN